MFNRILSTILNYIDIFITIIEVLSYFCIGFKFFLKEDKIFRFLLGCLKISTLLYLLLLFMKYIFMKYISILSLLLFVVLILSILVIISYFLYEPRGWKIKIKNCSKTLKLDLTQIDGRQDLKFDIEYIKIGHGKHYIKVEAKYPLTIIGCECPREHYSQEKPKARGAIRSLLLKSNDFFSKIEEGNIYHFIFLISVDGRPKWPSGSEVIKIYSNYRKVYKVNVEYKLGN